MPCGDIILANAASIQRLACEKRVQGLILQAEGFHRDHAAQVALRAAYDADIALKYLEIGDFGEDWEEAREGDWRKVVVANAAPGHGYRRVDPGVTDEIHARAQAATVWAYDVLYRKN